jgi:hypothetical protein
MDTLEVLGQDYHRNGSGGEGFVVSLVRWDVRGEQGATDDRFVAVSFLIEDGDASPEEKREYMRAHTAVLNVAMAAAGTVTFGTNSWRGADHVGPAVVSAWHANRLGLGAMLAYDPFGCGHEPQEEA